MANVNITMRIDEELKTQLQKLVSQLGLDMSTFFIMAAKQAVREQSLPFHPSLSELNYPISAYTKAHNNTIFKNGKPVIKDNDEWMRETEWDDLYSKIQNKKGK